MRLIKFNLSTVAVFLTEFQKGIIENENNSLINLFFKKVNEVFGAVKIYSNYRIPNRENLEFISEETELKFLFAVTDKLPPSQSDDKDFDEVFFAYFSGIAPLLSLDLTNDLLNRHQKYLAQYSYSENLPKGIVPYFISREFVNSLPDTLPSTAHEYLVKNLNNYDAEIFFQEPDLRQYRLDFSISDSRSLKMTEFFTGLNPDLEYKDLQTIILNNPNGLDYPPLTLKWKYTVVASQAAHFAQGNLFPMNQTGKNSV